jgi:hypothetical protein
MISGWVMALALFFTVLFVILIAIGVRLMTQNEIIIRSIPFGAPKIMERRPPPEDQRGTRPVAGTSRAEPSGRHG